MLTHIASMFIALMYMQMGDLPCRGGESEDEECVIWYFFEMCSYNCLSAMYQYYQVMICLLKFDFFAFTGVTMQVYPLLCLSRFPTYW